MKKRTSKLLSLLLTLVMVLGMLPMTAMAATGDSVDVWVGGVQMKVGYYLPSGNTPTEESLTTTQPSSDGYAYMEDISTLVLNDYSYEGEGYNIEGEGAVIVSAQYSILSIELQGTNELVNTATGDEILGIFTLAGLAITGNGSLIVGGSCGAIASYSGAISLTDCTVEAPEGIMAGSTITITNSTVNTNSNVGEGINASGTIAITNSTVNTNCGVGDGINTSSGNITITNSTVEANGATNYGIIAKENIIITDSNVTATGKTAAMNKKPNLSAYTDAHVMAGSSAITATKADLTTDYHNKAYVKILPLSEAVDCTLILEDGKVYNKTTTQTELTAAEAATLGISSSGTNYTFNNVNFSTSNGIAVEIHGDATITLVGTNRIISGDSSGPVYGILSNKDLSLTGGGKLSVTAGASSGDFSSGICATTLMIDGCDVTAHSNGGSSRNNQSGVRADTLGVKNSSLMATVSRSNPCDAGIVFAKEMSVINSTVTAQGIYVTGYNDPSLILDMKTTIYESSDLETWIILYGISAIGQDIYLPDSGKYIRFLPDPLNTSPHIHSFRIGEWIAEIPATCSSAGIKGHKDCTGCGKHFDAENTEITNLEIPINPDNHIFAAEWTWDAANHWHEAICVHTSEKKDAAAHNFGEWTVTIAATCTEKGKETCYCSCGATQTRDVDALGHTEVIDPAIAATCTETGKTEGKHCSVCDAVLFAQQTVPANGHAFGEWTVTTPATDIAQGEESCTCSVCGYVETKIIPELTHTHSYVEWIRMKAPTCTEKGEETSTCSCGATIAGEIDALGHTEVVDAAVAPTCTVTGLTEGKHCSVCNETLVAQQTVAATGHTFAAKWSKDATNHWHAATCGHTSEKKSEAAHTFGEWTVATPATETTKGEQTRTCSVCSYVETQEIPVLTKYRATVVGSYASTTGEDDYAEGATVSINAGTRSGYTFDRWTSDNGVTFADETRASTAFTMPGKAVTATANWKQKSSSGGEVTYDYYKLTFDTNGGSSIASITKIEGTTINLSSYKTIRAGYDFTGWYSDAALTSKVTSIKMNGSRTVYAGWEKKAAENPFVAISDNDYFYDAVLWAVENDIMQGTSANMFSPNATCTRAQAVTFLWRAAGCPEPQSSNNPFTDVSADAYYYKAVLWAVEQGITKGTSATTFSPDAMCSRAQIVTLLYRANGADTLNIKDNPFDDVVDGSYYYDAVLWAVQQGITNGTSETAFSPDADCTRGQIMTFLFRQYSK